MGGSNLLKGIALEGELTGQGLVQDTGQCIDIGARVQAAGLNFRDVLNALGA